VQRELNLRKYYLFAFTAALLLILVSSSCTTSYSSHELGLMFGRTVPKINDRNLKVDEIARGLYLPTRIAFLGPNDILVTQKVNGTVSRIINGTVLAPPLLDVNVASQAERGMAGIAVSKSDAGTYVFLYYTEAESKDGGKALGNRLYRYELINDKLVNPKLLLDLPATPGPFHNGGAVTIGPDGNVYVSVGNINAGCEFTDKNSSCQTVKSKAENYVGGLEPDGRAGILRVTKDGDNVEPGILGNNGYIIKYYAYGIRNSFGLDFDPVTGYLWDTENGPDYGDEINLVNPGFNSGWAKIEGIWKPNGTGLGEVSLKPRHLEDFGGKGLYRVPEFTWRNTVGPTAVTFVNTDKLGKQYQNDILVGDVNTGRIYHFDLNEQRTGFNLKGQLEDKIADTDRENRGIVFGHDFGEVTDIKVGPDGYVYVVVYSQQYGKILKIVPSHIN
jgi:glucose/arabinose dehydrogenase